MTESFLLTVRLNVHGRIPSTVHTIQTLFFLDIIDIFSDMRYKNEIPVDRFKR